MTRNEKYLAFKALHERPGTFLIPNPWNAGSARILTALGFEALATTSAGFAFNAGLRDSPELLTREGVLANAKEIVQATHLPVSADMQNGFGDAPESCVETIHAAVEVGLAGGSIEDATPDPQQPIYDFALAVERVAAAAEAAHKAHFWLTARAENFLWNRPDLDDTIRRLQAYAQAGADVVYAPGLPGLDAIRQVCASVSKPVNVLMGLKGATYTVEEIAAAGAKRISVGGSLARAALGAFVRAAREIKEQGTFTYASQAIPHAEVSAFMTPNSRA
jgi:2-methylisocitrate lyase-like PEP mutase family enzyme